jgi:translation initiation factor IF-2
VSQRPGSAGRPRAAGPGPRRPGSGQRPRTRSWPGPRPRPGRRARSPARGHCPGRPGTPGRAPATSWCTAARWRSRPRPAATGPGGRPVRPGPGRPAWPQRPAGWPPGSRRRRATGRVARAGPGARTRPRWPARPPSRRPTRPAGPRPGGPAARPGDGRQGAADRGQRRRQQLGQVGGQLDRPVTHRPDRQERQKGKAGPDGQPKAEPEPPVASRLPHVPAPLDRGVAAPRRGSSPHLDRHVGRGDGVDEPA